MKNPLFIIVALLCLTLAAAAKDQSIIVNGFGSVQVEPDTANVQLGVECSGKSAQAAQSENARLMKQVVEAIEKNGIAKKKLATSNFNIWPEVRYEQNQPPKTVGYRCGNQVNVTIEDLTLISKVIDSGIAAGANNVRGLHFSRQDDKEAKRLALSDAVAAASEKAKTIAKAAGLKITGVQSIIEGGTRIAPTQNNQMVGMASLKSERAETPVSPGLIEISGSVSITYSVE
ncbi:MAG: SIMPL domain-containing protein [Candidatus Margulisbacteria bacterium]|nr:SIMPL domain-containing protein [Candidatus Margulisiibacteriota bacterium]MBU1616947.1 SIMPL domain-containing protein [Candidatus Margulisiibacteriota bacterium]